MLPNNQFREINEAALPQINFIVYLPDSLGPPLTFVIVRGTYAIVAVRFSCPLPLLQKRMKKKHMVTELENERNPIITAITNVFISNGRLSFTAGVREGNQPNLKGYREGEEKPRTWSLTGKLSFPPALDATHT